MSWNVCEYLFNPHHPNSLKMIIFCLIYGLPASQSKRGTQRDLLPSSSATRTRTTGPPKDALDRSFTTLPITQPGIFRPQSLSTTTIQTKSADKINLDKNLQSIGLKSSTELNLNPKLIQFASRLSTTTLKIVRQLTQLNVEGKSTIENIQFGQVLNELMTVKFIAHDPRYTNMYRFYSSKYATPELLQQLPFWVTFYSKSQLNIFKSVYRIAPYHIVDGKYDLQAIKNKLDKNYIK